jgi:hypothetical protein
MRTLGMFAIVGALVIGAAGWVLSLVYRGPAAQQAIMISAVVAFVVQLLAFAIVRLSAGKNVIAGWGIGAVLRFLVFAVYVLVVVKAFALANPAAMISMAVFLFASTLLEPLFLKT